MEHNKHNKWRHHASKLYPRWFAEWHPEDFGIEHCESKARLRGVAALGYWEGVAPRAPNGFSGSKNFGGPKTFFDPKDLWPQKFFWTPKKFWPSKKLFDPKTFMTINLIHPSNYFEPKKLLDPNMFLDSKFFYPKKSFFIHQIQTLIRSNSNVSFVVYIENIYREYI